MQRIMNKYALLLFSVFCAGFLMFSLYACVNAEIEDNKGKRNILFYIGGDNSLGYEPRQKIDEMRKGWQPGKGEMLIYVDQRDSDAYLLRITDEQEENGYYILDTLETYVNDNSADCAVLSRVVDEVVNGFPADSYGMIFFSHASGWLPEGMLAHPRSLVIDGSDGPPAEMEYYDFAAAIPDKTFDFIIIEACLMADVMSMYELRHKADYILASPAEIVSPGFTTIYMENVMGLFNKKQSVEVLLKEFANAYCKKDKNYNFYTLSILKMSEMDALAEVTKTILKGKAIGEENLTMAGMQTFDRPNALIVSGTKRSRYFDLGHTLSCLVSESEYNTFNNQLRKTVVWKEATDSFLPGHSGFYVSYYSGLTTYIKQSVFPELNEAFENSSWYKAILP